jgi:hypothetical protein
MSQPENTEPTDYKKSMMYWHERAIAAEAQVEKLRERLISRIDENSALLVQVEEVRKIWLEWRENGMANAVTRAGEFMHRIGKVVEPDYPTDRLRAPEPVPPGEAAPTTPNQEKE